MYHCKGYCKRYKSDIDFSGYFETRHCLQTKSPNKFLAAETMVRMEMRTAKNDISLFASTDFSANHLFEDESKVSLHEAYIDYVSSSWDLRAGSLKMAKSEQSTPFFFQDLILRFHIFIHRTISHTMFLPKIQKNQKHPLITQPLNIIVFTLQE